MAVINPFTTVFGGNPASFFGRDAILREFDVALKVPGSGYRALFLTGTRGSGKTCLLERLSARALTSGWEVIDLTADEALWSLFRSLAPYDRMTESNEPTIGAQVFGIGRSFGGKGHSRSRTILPADLAKLFVDHCREAGRGVFVTLDEVQKVPVEDVSQICSAFQMASRKGYDVALAVAGLPYARDLVIHHDGCTFMRRAQHVIVDLLTREEVREAYLGVFGDPASPLADDGAILRLVELTRGQPYLMQLLGYYAFALATGSAQDGAEVVRPIDREGADLAFAAAYQPYAQLALAPILDEVKPSGVSYLKAMVRNLDEHHVASTAMVATSLGKTPSQLSKVRDRLLGLGVVIAAGRGKLRFGIPYLREYLSEDHASSDRLSLAESWDV